MRFNKIPIFILIFLMVIMPIALSNDDNNINEDETISVEPVLLNSSEEINNSDSELEPEIIDLNNNQINNLSENITIISDSEQEIPETTSDITEQEPQAKIEENKPLEITKPTNKELPNFKKYLPNSIKENKYEVKKLGNRQYEYIQEKDGKKFNSLEEIKESTKINENTKLGKDFEQKLNKQDLNKPIRLLVFLKTNLITTQKQIEQIKDEYKESEEKIKEDIRSISIKYSPKTKKQAKVLAETNEIIEIPKEELDKIKDKGRELEKINEERIRTIKNKLSSESKEVQDTFVNWIEDNDGEIKRELDGIVSIEIPVELLEDVLDRSEVSFVELDEIIIEPKLDVSNPTISTSGWWNAGYNGYWTDTAVVDTGIDVTHPALAIDAENVARTFISQDFISSGTIDDTNGHGTHVAGIIASSDSTYEGITPGVDKLINAKAIPGFSSDILAGLDWAITNPSDGAEILSNSWGYAISDCNDPGFNYSDGETIYSTKYIDAVVDYYDIISVNAAGNEGACGYYSLVAPADSYNSIVVGNIDDQGTTSRSDDTISSSSSIGPTWDGRKKPDIVAPGTNIRSTAYDWEGSNPDFVDMSGTSMAAPHVSGAANLLLEYGLSSKGVKALMINTAEDKGSYGWDPYYGWGEINLNDAYTYRDYVLNGTVNEGSYKLYEVQIVLAGEKATLVWNKHNTYIGVSTPTTLYDINDLDLLLFNQSDGSLQNYSAAYKDNVEQINSPAQFLNGVVKVEAYTTNFNHGLDTEDYSLATQRGYTLANGPNLNISVNTPATANDTGFNVTCTVGNAGDLYAHNVWTSIILPTGLNIISGQNPQNLGTISTGNISTVTWTLNGVIGARNIACNYTSYSYGEIYNGTSATESANIQDDDSTGPATSNWIFPLTNKTYNPINVYADITDVSGISSAILHYDYGNDDSEDGTITMNSTGGNTYTATIPPAGNNYRNQNVSYYIESTDNDNDRTNDTASSISETKSTFLENEAPTITSFEPTNTTQSIDEASSLMFNYTANDLDGDALTISWQLDSVEQTTNQSWTYSPDYYSSGTHNISLIISDGIDTDSQEWIITVNNVNQIPTWDFIPENQTIQEETTLNYDVNASDPDLSQILYFINDTNFSIDANGLITWMPLQDWVGSKEITITASDTTDNITASITITVTNVNDHPVLQEFANITINESNLVTIIPVANDVDGDGLTFNYSSPINASGQWQTNFNDAGTYTVTVTANDGNGGTDSKNIIIVVNNDMDEDGMPDYADTDNDNDGIPNSADKLFGNLSNINTNIGCLSITVNDSTNLTQIFTGKLTVEIKNTCENKTITLFNFDFDSSTLNLYNLTIQQQSNSSNTGSLLINGLGELPSGETKTIYLDNLNESINSTCILDDEISSISEISENCNQENETLVTCNGTEQSGYACTDLGSIYQITGLKHSGVKEGICTESWTCIDWSACSGGAQTRTCTDQNSCGTIVNKPTETQSCSSGGGSSGGGGGGGGGGFSKPKNATINQTSACSKEWVCGEWMPCKAEKQTRACKNGCEEAMTDMKACTTNNANPYIQVVNEPGVVDKIIDAISEQAETDINSITGATVSITDTIKNNAEVGLAVLAAVIIGGTLGYTYLKRKKK